MKDSYSEIYIPLNMKSNKNRRGAMDNNALSSTGGSQNDPNTSEVTFIGVYIAVIFAWVAVTFASRMLENLSFGQLGLNGNSFWNSTLVFVVITILFISTVWVIDQYDLIPGRLSTDLDSSLNL